MRSLPTRYDPAQIEAETAAFWKSRQFPSPEGGVGPSAGAIVHQFVTPLTSADSGLDFLQRAVRADADARFLALSGRRSLATLASRRPDYPSAQWVTDQLRNLGIWTGGGQLGTIGSVADPERIQAGVDRLAALGVIRAREAPVRACPSCLMPRNPSGIIYAAESGDAYLVRFPLAGATPRTSLLVWTDAAWKLLGTCAVLVNPDLPYVVVRYLRRGSEERVLVLKSAIERLKQWLEGCEVEVLEEHLGAHWVGHRYEHPLQVEFPILAGLPDPAGSVVASPAVDDSGTGVVALVPGHGASDEEVGRRLGILGWTVVGSEAQLTRDLQHKYAGLPVEIGEAFILRDLTDSGNVFAQLRVRRGVPHCAVCGSVLYWQLARSWCLEPARFPASLTDTFTRLSGADELPKAEETVVWPVSGWRSSDEVEDPELLECPQCGRLAPRGAPSACECGGSRRPVRRTLLPVLVDALALWASETPFVPGDDVRFYLAQRRAVPSTLHFILGMVSVRASPGDVRRLTCPTLPPEGPAGPGVLDPPADATRAALLLTSSAPRDRDQTLTARRRQEARRLRKVWQISQDVVGRFLSTGFSADTRPVADRLGELQEEDRAILSLFERMRAAVLKAYDTGRIDHAHDLLARFWDAELRGGYLPLVASRLDRDGPVASRTAVFRVLAHILPLWTELYAPIAPFTMEAIHRGLRGDSQSIFERTFTPVQDRLIDISLEDAYRRWRTVVGVLANYRRDLGLAAGTLLPSAVLVAPDDASAGALRTTAAVLGRLAGVGTIDIASPGRPWDGRELTVRPVEAEIQRAYPTQARRLVRILEGMGARRIQEAITTQTLEIVVEGARLPIAPAMVEVTESLPKGVVLVPSPIGEIYLTLPGGTDAPGRPPLPPLSPDGYRFLHAVTRRIARASAPSAIDTIHVAARGRFADTLARDAGALSAHLSGVEVIVHPDASDFVRGETSRGRAGRGDPWSLWIPGAPLRVTVKDRTHPRTASRVRSRPMAAEGLVSIDYMDDALRERESAIRAAVETFDHDLGRPLIGPSKLAAAWQAGFTSHDAVAHAPFESLAAVAGFGPIVAATVVGHYGGAVPRPVRRAPASPLPLVTTSRPAILPPSLRPAESLPAAVREPQSAVPSEDRPAMGPEAAVASPELSQAAAPPEADDAPASVVPYPLEFGRTASDQGDRPDPSPADRGPRGAGGADSSPESPGGVTSSQEHADLPDELPVEEGPPPPELPPQESVNVIAHSSETVGPGTTSAAGIPSSDATPPGLRDSGPGQESTSASPTAVSAPLPTPPMAEVMPAPPAGAHAPLPPASVGPTVDPPAEKGPVAGEPPFLLSGIEVWPDPTSERALASFVESVCAGVRGLCLSREFPDRLRRSLGPRSVEVVWLSNVGREGSVRPSDLDALHALFQRFLGMTGPRVAYIEGVEYLLRIHGLEHTMDLLRSLDEGAKSQGVRVWLPLNPALVDPAAHERLAAAFRSPA